MITQLEALANQRDMPSTIPHMKNTDYENIKQQMESGKSIIHLPKGVTLDVFAKVFGATREGTCVTTYFDGKVGVPDPDPVNHPSHYTTGTVECIDAIRASMTEEEFRGFLKGQVIKYVWRYRHKGAEQQDLDKMLWYGNKLRDHV